jgi:hypothetical protein
VSLTLTKYLTIAGGTLLGIALLAVRAPGDRPLPGPAYPRTHQAAELRQGPVESPVGRAVAFSGRRQGSLPSSAVLGDGCSSAFRQELARPAPNAVLTHQVAIQRVPLPVRRACSGAQEFLSAPFPRHLLFCLWLT